MYYLCCAWGVWTVILAALAKNLLHCKFSKGSSTTKPNRVLLASGANVSFIGLDFAQHQSLPLTEITKFPFYLVSSLEDPRMDGTILGHELLVHWNPDVNWQEGVKKAEPSIKGFLYSMILSHPPLTAVPSLKDDDEIKDLETIRKTLSCDQPNILEGDLAGRSAQGDVQR
ncbi:putative signal peptide protein [Puccinia sorghi]|uniref:Putative signal peptide protein n=1 Tax=Puccinia sorghi TaxID=27349 RepID=A0A0L6V5K7_9BASI|nr:putative signal peptide protein [Puccinia sorghi]